MCSNPSPGTVAVALLGCKVSAEAKLKVSHAHKLVGEALVGTGRWSPQRPVPGQSAGSKWPWRAPPQTSLSLPPRLQEHDGREGGKKGRTEDGKERCKMLAAGHDVVAVLMTSAVVPEGRAVRHSSRKWGGRIHPMIPEVRSWGRLTSAGRGGVIFFGASLWSVARASVRDPCTHAHARSLNKTQ